MTEGRLNSANGGSLIDTPEGIRYFQLLQVNYALDIEVNTGLRHSRGSILKLANQRGYAVSKTKKNALMETEAYLAGAQYALGLTNTMPELPKVSRLRQLAVAAFERGKEAFSA